MINGAQEIIGGVPGQHLDPLLLAKSQTRESIGFIMIAYEQIVHSQKDVTENLPQTRRFYDLFFFRGPVIYECARLNQDLRFKLNITTALQTFNQYREEGHTLVYLFQAADDLIHQFRSTFYYEPCLKVQIEALTKKQIVTLLKSSRCQQGIIECNEFTQMKPAIQLVEIHSQEQLADFQPTLRHGRLLLYDSDKNKEIIRERYSIPFEDITKTIERYQTFMDEVFDTRNVIAPSLKNAPTHIQISLDQHGRDKSSSNILEDDAIASSFRMRNEADEFTKFIQQILNSPMSSEVKRIDKRQKSVEPQQGFVIHVDEEQINSHPEISDSTSNSNIQLLENTHGEKSHQERMRSKQRKPLTAKKELSKTDSKEIPLSSFQTQQQPSEYVHLFERLFRSFRQQVFECFGDKCEAVITRAEQKVRFLSPEFDCRNLNDSTVLTILDVIESIIQEASMFKRSKLRQAAITLISDLYNKQYDLLEQHRAIDKIEQTYYRLKK